MPASESGALSARVRASAAVAFSTSAAATTSCTMPMARARRASISRPVKSRWRVLAGPMISSSFWARAKPGTRPMRASGMPSRAPSRRSQVAVQRELAAAGDGVAVDHRDGGVARGLDPAQHRHDVHLGLARLHLAQVAARAESGPGAAHHHHPHVAPRLEVIEDGGQRAQQRGVHGVARVGTVEGDSGDVVGDGEQDLVRNMARWYIIRRWPGRAHEADLRSQRRIARITINRPEAMNAMDADVYAELSRAWIDVRDNPTCGSPSSPARATRPSRPAPI